MFLRSPSADVSSCLVGQNWVTCLFCIKENGISINWRNQIFFGGGPPGQSWVMFCGHLSYLRFPIFEKFPTLRVLESQDGSKTQQSAGMFGCRCVAWTPLDTPVQDFNSEEREGVRWQAESLFQGRWRKTAERQCGFRRQLSGDILRTAAMVQVAMAVRLRWSSLVV